ncbi:34425_t:CDS:2 [Gigaspora margarita]|uniref:34425_t:CDS:1 n=1 Tax=Gigaspora margarita TaxID=4874 RepID=A0ABN7UQQ6_GIGMA|nr:34425_t:CDS:2 [Gigaspora margarita]
MSTKDPKESIVKIEEDGEVKELYLATNPFSNFVVEFELLSSGSNELTRHYHNEIDTSKQKTFEFKSTQSNLITSKNKLSWSDAVSNRLYKHKSRNSTYRLLAISCIGRGDKTYKEPKDPKDPNDTSGFTIVFFIDQDDYSIKEILTLDKCGGIVKLFSKCKVKERAYKNRFFLTILNGYGIHKYHFKYLHHKPARKIRSFKYPKRIYNALKKNKKFGPEFNQKYIEKCLNLYHFLVDTTDEGAQYMELYDLRTNQLINTFKRQNLNSLNLIADIPDCVAISHNNKLLAYASGNCVKLYLIDCGLEIASIEIIKNVKESEQKSIELKDHLVEHQLEFDLKMLNIFSNRNCSYQLERSNSFVLIVKNKEEDEKIKLKIGIFMMVSSQII